MKINNKIALQLDPIKGIDNPYVPDPNSSNVQAYTDSAEKIISAVLTILSIIGAIMFAINFILGGLNWITAGGDKNKIETAKNQMTGAAIGLITIAASYAITYIVSMVTGIPILDPGKAILDNFK